MLKWFGGLLSVGVGALLLAHGTGEAGVREVIRWTARSSLCLLCMALVADGIRGNFAAWRYWTDVLRSLALSHGVHAVAIGALAWYTHGRNLLERGPIVILGGGLAYLFIILGAFRPRSRSVSLGLFWIWGVFFVSYLPRALRMPIPYGFAVGLLAVSMLVRVVSSFKTPVSESQTA
jgi:hypothetical protein